MTVTVRDQVSGTPRRSRARPKSAPVPPSPTTVRSIRERLAVTVLVLTMAALAVAGIVSYSLQWNSVQNEAYAQLGRDATEFTALASANINPESGVPFANVTELLSAAVSRRPLSDSDGVMGIVGGKVAIQYLDTAEVQPQKVPDFVATAISVSNRTQQTIDRFDYGGVDYAYLVVPVFEAGQPRGALVRVVDLNIKRGELLDVFGTFALVAVGASLVTAAISWLVMARLLQPIEWVRRTANEISEHDLSRRIPVRGRDDLAALTITVNTMLDRLEGAVGAQRRLLDDVGHELRTPMTIIRGHLELMDTADPSDAEVVRELALEELSRMSNLVNDLLLLAQAERPDFVVETTVDVGRLTDETFEKVRVLGGRPWIMDDLADVTAELDPQRITQAWLQLAENAVKYSPEGSSLGMGSRVEDDTIRFWVRDQGMGFTEEEKTEVLERFGRGSRAGMKRTESAGLGLAIVNSIAIAHGGRVEIDSIPDVGSTVSLVIPRQRQSE